MGQFGMARIPRWIGGFVRDSVSRRREFEESMCRGTRHGDRGSRMEAPQVCASCFWVIYPSLLTVFLIIIIIIIVIVVIIIVALTTVRILAVLEDFALRADILAIAAVQPVESPAAD